MQFHKRPPERRRSRELPGRRQRRYEEEDARLEVAEVVNPSSHQDVVDVANPRKRAEDAP